MDTLRDAQEKLKSTIDLVGELKGIDFPHPDASQALNMLEGILKNRLEDLQGFDSEASKSVIRSYCIQSTADIAVSLQLLGFIVNSTSVRNAFEVHQSLLGIARQLINHKAKLLLSFEWGYVPFTYPQNVPQLPSFVVIGLPASEANNALIIPAAGHELGHSAWRYYRMREKVDLSIQQKVKELIVSQHWKKFLDFTSPYIKNEKDVDSLLGRQIWKRSHVWALRQVEELFCDIVGLNIFGAAYLHAFSYLLAPKYGEVRTEKYPDLITRARYLEQASKKLNISVPSGFVDRFDKGREPYDQNQFSALLLKVADASVDALFGSIYDLARQLCKSNGFLPPDESEWISIVDAFQSHVPAAKAGNLANIVNAGWAVCRDESIMNTLAGKDRRSMAALNELMLKSIEVLEIESMQEGAKRGSKGSADS